MNLWTVERKGGDVGALHAPATPPAARSVTFMSVTAPGLVLGSTQPLIAGAVRRRSGGGAVWLEPGGQVWADLVVPRGDPLWDDDVGRAFWWLGEVWVSVLAAVGISDASVHRGGFVCPPYAKQICFAGLGPGEVSVGSRKVVGMAQRRTREAALFQCSVPLRWDPTPIVSALGLPARAIGDLADVVLPLGPMGITADAVEAALLAALPQD